ncbi:MAG: DegT/DnrJ/EryC1/StrS aminotransferase family protein [Candidatus Eisenbacteria bacterium]|nr:DegT/DnrJ/EryC1/StrS aminotransferase family protein [Candidatus Eisenbacteria bacterium]
MSALRQPIRPAGLPEGLEDHLEVVALTRPVPFRTAAQALSRTLGLGPGARVALPVWGCTQAAEALRRGGCDVVPLDVDPDTGRLDVSSVAREGRGFEALWCADVDGLPPDGPQLAALARRRDAVVVEEVRESLGAMAQGFLPGAHADAVLLHGPDRAARIASADAGTVEEAGRKLPPPSVEVGAPADPALEEFLAALPARVAGQRRLAALWESAWGPLDGVRLPEYARGTRGTWPRYTVRVLFGSTAYPNAAWARQLHARGVRVARPQLRLALGLDPDDPHVRRSFPGAVEYLRRALSFPCEAAVTLEEAERTVYALDELARREAAGHERRPDGGRDAG